MMGNKYPITEIGLAKLVEKLIEKGERDKKVGPAKSRSKKFRSRWSTLPEDRSYPSHPDPQFDFHMAQIFIDTERMIPLRYAPTCGPKNRVPRHTLEEEYTYIDVRLNVGLKDSDFDPNNPAYKYP